VLIRTGWDRRWGTRGYGRAAPYLASGTVDALIQGGTTLVGVDFGATETQSEESREALERMFRAGVVLVENLCNLSALPSNNFRVFAIPLARSGMSPLPVRAFAELLPQ
jgi:arylformamidase